MIALPAEVTSVLTQWSAKIRATPYNRARGQTMTDPQQPHAAPTSPMLKFELKTLIPVLTMCGGMIAWTTNYVGQIRDSVRDNALQVAYMKEDVKRIDSQQTKVQQDVREDLRRIEDKLDRAISDQRAESQSVRKWAK